MKPFIFLVVVILLADLAAPWPFSNESGDGDDDGDDDNNGEDGDGGEDDDNSRGGNVDEAFLAGTNRTFTFGECSSFAGKSGQMELVTSRCGSANVYYSSMITFRVTNPTWSSSSSVNDPSCAGGSRARVVAVPCVMTCIRALDLKEGGSGRANVTVVQGGVGRDSIRVRVDGELGRGYYYLIQAYANCTIVNQRQVKY